MLGVNLAPLSNIQSVYLRFGRMTLADSSRLARTIILRIQSTSLNTLKFLMTSGDTQEGARKLDHGVIKFISTLREPRFANLRKLLFCLDALDSTQGIELFEQELREWLCNWVASGVLVFDH